MSIVHLTPDGGRAAAALCEEAAAALTAQSAASAALVYGLDAHWLGECAEGRGWVRLLYVRAVGPSSLRSLLEGHAANLRLMAVHFRNITGNYADADRLPGL